ncbi:MAG: hypothetical protein QOE92_454, partial [Chloroflexota bacterium]|nr:hypothetical protein [Chloroflexota bacterium]
ALEGLDAEEAVDRLALVAGLRRALPPDGPRAPTGAVAVERHLLAQATRLAGGAAAAEPLAHVLEAAPGHLAASREGTLGAGAAASSTSPAAKRLPLLLDVMAAAASPLRLSPALRARVEGAAGAALAAAAEHGGWLLKEYLPAANGVAVPSMRPLDLGLGAALEELEAEAERVLADVALSQDPGAAATEETRAWRLEDVATAWGEVDAGLREWCPLPAGGTLVEESPAWLRPLLPPVALVDAGADRPRLLVDPALELSPADLDGELRRAWTHDLAPAAWDGAGSRPARLLLPSPDGRDGWRDLARATAPGLDAWRPADARRERAWRAILALTAAGLGRGRMDLDEATRLVAAEAGLDIETARLQAAHVAAQPVAALAFVAGRLVAARVLAPLGAASDAAAARAAFLAAGPLPAAGYTP